MSAITFAQIRAPTVAKRGVIISKSDDDKRQAFGWANVSVRADGEVIEDWQEDIIDIAELEHHSHPAPVTVYC
ncbi:MAG: hypothetical protein LBN97_06020 [Oscillospiraceae bacterium]|jgi:hypothetical protein|nr:hypothetical protein [Oscillospiraceae bacterium]